ncbi:hypothetical protein Bca101_010611 [Brassica carinata]
MIFIGLGVWQTYVVRRFYPRAISRSIRRYRVPPFSSPVISPISTNLVSPSCFRVFSLFKLTIRSVTAWDHIFSDQIFSDNIFSDCKSSVFCLKTTIVVFY